MAVPCLFVSDLHGRAGHVRRLIREIDARRPAGVFIGGDLLPPFAGAGGEQPDDFIANVLVRRFGDLRAALGRAYPRVFLILGNDDARVKEESVIAAGAGGLWVYAHAHEVNLAGWRVYGYSFVPPTPFSMKDWELYDVSRYVDPGCVSPEEGFRTIEVAPREIRYRTIATDLDALGGGDDLRRSIWLFHAPPYQTALDRAALDGRSVDHTPVDVHVGSIAIRRFIERRQPALTLHGHIHESARLTGQWVEQLRQTIMISAAHDGPELALVSFDPGHPAEARRELLETG